MLKNTTHGFLRTPMYFNPKPGLWLPPSAEEVAYSL